MQIHLIVQWIWKENCGFLMKELSGFCKKEVEYLNSYYKLIDYIEAYVKGGKFRRFLSQPD